MHLKIDDSQPMHTLGSSVRTAKASHGNKISFTSHIQNVDKEGKDGSKTQRGQMF